MEEPLDPGALDLPPRRGVVVRREDLADGLQLGDREGRLAGVERLEGTDDRDGRWVVVVGVDHGSPGVDPVQEDVMQRPPLVRG